MKEFESLPDPRYGIREVFGWWDCFGLYGENLRVSETEYKSGICFP